MQRDDWRLHDKTVIRFRDQATNDLYAYWIDFVGQPRLLPRDDPDARPLHLPPGQETFLPTLARRVWLVSLAPSLEDLRKDLKGSCVKIFIACDLPGKALITQGDLPPARPAPQAKGR